MIQYAADDVDFQAEASIAEEGRQLAFEAPNLSTEVFRRFKVPFGALKYLIAAVDALLIVSASYVGGGLYQIIVSGEFKNAEQIVNAGLTAAVLYFLAAMSTGHYEFASTLIRRRDAARIFVLWASVGLLLALLAFLMKSGAAFSRGSIVSFGIFGLCALLVSRPYVKRSVAAAVSSHRVRGKRAVLLGLHDELVALGNHGLLENFGVTEVQRILLPQTRQSGLSLSDAQSRSVRSAIQSAREFGADELVLLVPWNDPRKLELLRDCLRVSPLPVRLLPDARIRSLTRNPSYRLSNSLSLEIQRAPLSLSEQTAKRFIDIVGAVIGLIMLSPLIVLTAIAVKIDSKGPILFRQRRNGFNSKRFSIFKFRSMTVMEDGEHVVQAQRNDARVTTVGKVLRRTSIDEIPQLLNVLRGEMSLVGPRPHALAHDDYYENILADYAYRHHVKPGITGWAQVRGYRGETARVEQMRARVQHDIWYINNWNLLLDIKILVLTAIEVPLKRNAY